MKIIEGPMIYEVVGLPTEKDVQEEFDKIMDLLKGRRKTEALSRYVFDELLHALTKKIAINALYNHTN